MAAERRRRQWHAVVLNWNGRDDTIECLQALTSLEDPVAEIICVDNGSTDGSIDAVRERFPGVTLIEAGRNLGYSGGNNLGIHHALEAGAEWIMLVNNDAVVGRDVISGFERAAAARPSAGVIAGTVYFSDRPDTIWFAGQRVNTRLGYSGRPRGYGRKDSRRYRRIVDTGRAVGALMAISRETLMAVGYFDDALFAYVEDVDLALRARAAGFDVIVAPEARAWHRISASTGGEAATTATLYYGVRNTVTVLERHRPLGWVGKVLRRGVIYGSFLAHALLRPDRAAALAAVHHGYMDARAARLGPRPDEAQSPSALRNAAR